MNYSNACYQIHSLSFNRKQTVDKSREILDSRVENLNLKTRAILNNPQLKAITEFNELPGFLLDNNNVLGKLNYPEIGLWASNYDALKTFLSSDKEYIFILEDDIKLKNNFYDLMDSYFPQIPSDMDCFMIFNPENIFFSRGYEDLQNESQYYTGSQDVWIAHQTWSTGAIMFNKSGAQKVVDYIESGVGLKYDAFILGADFNQYDPNSNTRSLKVYSLSKDAERLCTLDRYPSMIQGATIIENI